MKKIIAFTVGAVAVIGLSGCSKTETTNETTVVNETSVENVTAADNVMATDNGAMMEEGNASGNAAQ